MSSLPVMQQAMLMQTCLHATHVASPKPHPPPLVEGVTWSWPREPMVDLPSGTLGPVLAEVVVVYGVFPAWDAPVVRYVG